MQNKKSIKGVVPTLSDVAAIHSKICVGKCSDPLQLKAGFMTCKVFDEDNPEP